MLIQFMNLSQNLPPRTYLHTSLCSYHAEPFWSSVSASFQPRQPSSIILTVSIRHRRRARQFHSFSHGIQSTTKNWSILLIKNVMLAMPTTCMIILADLRTRLTYGPLVTSSKAAFSMPFRQVGRPITTAPTPFSVLCPPFSPRSAPALQKSLFCRHIVHCFLFSSVWELRQSGPIACSSTSTLLKYYVDDRDRLGQVKCALGQQLWWVSLNILLSLVPLQTSWRRRSKSVKSQSWLLDARRHSHPYCGVHSHAQFTWSLF